MDYAVIDARVSTEGQERGYSLEGQVKAGLDYAAKHHLEVPKEYVFQESHTGTDIDRPTIQLIREVFRKDKRVKYIIVYSLDRLARTALGLLLLEREFKKAGVKVVYVKYDFDDTPEGQLQKNIYMSFVEFERATIVQRFSKGRKDKVDACKPGQYLGGHNPPYGYRNRVELSGDANHPVKTNWLERDAEEWNILCKIFIWVAYGDGPSGSLSVSAVARKLTEQRVPCANARRNPNDKHRKTPLYHWNAKVVHDIITNEVYVTGLWYYGRRTFDRGVATPVPKELWKVAQVPKLIEPTLWRAANRQIEESKHRHHLPRGTHKYLLAGRITCALCGKPFYCRTYPPDERHSKPQPYYGCRGTDSKTHAFDKSKLCLSSLVNVPALDNLVWNWLCDLFADPETVMLGLKKRKSEQEKVNALSLERLETINEEISRWNREMQSMLRSLAQENCEPGSPKYKMYMKVIDNDDARIRNLEEERTRIQQDLNSVVLTDDTLNRAEQAMKNIDENLRHADMNKRIIFVSALDVRVVVKAPRGDNHIWIQANCCVTESGIMQLTRGRDKKARVDLGEFGAVLAEDEKVEVDVDAYESEPSS